MDQRMVGSLRFGYGRPDFMPDNKREEPLPVLQDPNNVLQSYQAGDRVVAKAVQRHGKTVAQLVEILPEDSPDIADFSYVCLAHDLPGAFAEEIIAAAEEKPTRPVTLRAVKIGVNSLSLPSTRRRQKISMMLSALSKPVTVGAWECILLTWRILYVRRM